MSEDPRSSGAVPEPAIPSWHAIVWAKVHRTVRRLQARIVKAIREGRWNKVNSLVYLLTHSFAGKALAVLRVTSNSGAKTPGLDGIVWDTPEAKSEAIYTLESHRYSPQPLRRVYIPKSDGKKRPLGIPTVKDRAMQALYLLGLDPISECTADPNSYGFRRGRSCADALQQCANILGCGPHAPQWVLEGDIKSCFDRIDHDWLLAHIPMEKSILRSWLKSGCIEKRVFHATSTGTPQGGILSPVLANWTLDGLEGMLHQHFANTPIRRKLNKVHLVRYADDFIITGTSKFLLEYEVQPLVEHFLQERGLELSHEKTRIAHITDGFDFLGQHLRRYRSGKVLTKPSRTSIARLLTKLRVAIFGESGSQTAGELIDRLNLQIRGWTLYHRHTCSSRIFTRIDRCLFEMLWRWCERRHDSKSATWIKGQYFHRVDDRAWVFTGTVYDRKGRPLQVQLMEAAKVHITRHIKIRSAANPYDPKCESYFEMREQNRMTSSRAGRRKEQLLYRRQDGRCSACGEPLSDDTGWHIHHRVWRVYGGSDGVYNLELMHPHCHRRLHQLE